MIKRPTLDLNNYAPAAADQMNSFHPDIVGEVAATVARDAVVVVGMKTNPVVKKARRVLTEAGVAHTVLEYGSYTSKWKQRLAIKMWSGWPTFPQVFVRGKLIGGEDLTKAALADGSIKELLATAKT